MEGKKTTEGNLKKTDEMNPHGQKDHLKPSATNGYPMTDHEKKNIEVGAGVKPSKKT